MEGTLQDSLHRAVHDGTKEETNDEDSVNKYIKLIERVFAYMITT